MQIDVITLFPDFFKPIVEGSIIGRAQSKGLATITVHDLWRYVPEGERADDAPYGGGAGMVLRLGPLIGCLEELLGSELETPDACEVVVPSPAGERFNQAQASHLASLSRLILVCGHYEAIDERFFDLVTAREVSLGDFVMTGGEIAALAFIDAAVRLIPGTIAAESARNESFAGNSLDWPHYTRPAVFRGLSVPEVLLTGDHAKIDSWRRASALQRTAARRPDLLREP